MAIKGMSAWLSCSYQHLYRCN